MNRLKGLDLFRVIASLMVIAIHTFPFSSINPALDSLITLTLFRVAVPFFYMITGYFILGPINENRNYLNIRKYKDSLVDLIKLYCLSMILYLPLSILNNTIGSTSTIIDLFKSIFLEGTFYHLWYFPSMITGLLIINYLFKFSNLKLTGIISLFLYVIGLLGDSYYSILGYRFKIIEEILKISPFTRNGLFFSPIFLVLGVYLYKRNKKVVKKDYIFLLLSILGLLLEGYIVNIKNIPKHNSMYIFLLPTMYFLFKIIKNIKVDFKLKGLNRISTIVYIIHPIIIYIYYLFEKLIFKIDNSILEYIIVSIVSFSLAFILKDIKKPEKEKLNFRRSTKKINIKNLNYNLNEIKSIIDKNSNIMAVVKSNSYGHGIDTVKSLNSNGVRYFAVATIDEGIYLRKSKIVGEILVFGYTPLDRIDDLVYYDLTLSLIDYEYGLELDKLKKYPKCHIKVDSGMHRLGIDSKEKDKFMILYKLRHINIKGIYSHLASSDSLDIESQIRSKNQIKAYDELIGYLKERGINIGLTHIQSSYGLLNYNELKYDLVRIGVILFGNKSSKSDKTKIELDLKPVMTIEASLIQIKKVGFGEYIGYGLGYKADKDMRIGIVSIGYADGIPRGLSNKNFNLFYKGEWIKVIGRICMDMLLVDLRDIDIKVGEELLLMESGEDIAYSLDTITNEVLSRIGDRNIEKTIL